MKALVIREPWIDLILDGKKTWELRTQPTSIRGRIALIRKGSGRVEGVATLVDVLRPLQPQDLAESIAFHGVPVGQHQDVVANNWLTPWVLVDAKRLAVPVPYSHPSGAVTWVDLETSVGTAVAQAIPRANQVGDAPPAPSPPPALRPTSSLVTAATRPTPSSKANAPKISPALEARLVLVAEECGFKVKPLLSAQTKMWEFTIPDGAGNRFVFVDRMPASTPNFRVFLEPRVDEIIADRIGSINGISRFQSRTRGDHRFRHSAFRAFAPHDAIEGEPMAHGWLVSTHRADDAFRALLRCVSPG